MKCGNCGQKISALFPNGNCIECNSGGAKLVPFSPPEKRDIFKEAFATLVTAASIDHQQKAREHIADKEARRQRGRRIRRRAGFTE